MLSCVSLQRFLVYMAYSKKQAKANKKHYKLNFFIYTFMSTLDMQTGACLQSILSEQN